MMILPLLTDLLNIPSPTFQEQALTHFIEDWMRKRIANLIVKQHGQSRILSLPLIEGLPHIALVGHSDVVPDHFEAYRDAGQIHGAGASDMQGSLAVFAVLMQEFSRLTDRQFNFSFILYDAEEGTSLEQNGLCSLIAAESDFLQTIDLAIVGEPTNGQVQLGCVGSLHAKVVVSGVACHSARPWDGQNALYNALPLITGLSKIEPLKRSILNVDFFDVINITESCSQAGRTTIPGQWSCNINYRYAPGPSMAEAEVMFQRLLMQAKTTTNVICEIVDHVPAAQIIESELFHWIVSWLKTDIAAKQAWTDVAQLNGVGIPAFNFGPGLTAQAHKPDEYILVEDMVAYYHLLRQLAHFRPPN